MDQLVQCLTDDKYKGNLVAVVAGYVHDIDGLMEANPGLASRFPETLHFPNFGVDDCCRLLDSSLKNGFSTELAPDAVAELRELLPPIVQVRHVSSAGNLLFSLASGNLGLSILYVAHSFRAQHGFFHCPGCVVYLV